MTLAASTSTDKILKDFDELMSTPIDFSGYILNGLKIKNLTQEVLLGPAFRLLKGTRSSYAELEYEFEECYKALSEKLDWENLEGDEPKKETASRSDWFKKPTPPQEPTDPDWNVGKTTIQGPTQTWLMNLAASNPTDKSLKDFDELISTPIDFSSFVLNGLKCTRSNYAELEYYFEECYKALSEKLDWENPEGGDYPFGTFPNPFPSNIAEENLKRYHIEFFITNESSKYPSRGISTTQTYTRLTIKTKAAKYDLPGIEDMVPNIWSPVKVAYDKFKEGDFPRLRINDIVDMLILVVQNRLTNLSGDDVADFAIALRMFTRSLVIQRRAEDLQLFGRFKDFQKQSTSPKPDTTRPILEKGTLPYTP
ncbi:hypothetical protein Tco_1531527 [Tanacetum coccineum]